MKMNIVQRNGCKNLPSLKSKIPESGDWAKMWSCKMALWKRERTGNRRDPNSKAFWDGFDFWESYETYTRYPGELMKPILECIDTRTTILDVGTGTGALALPMARAARRVTALEPSSAQCERLKRKAADWGVINLAVVENTFEEVSMETLRCHDVVTAGYCLFMEDIQEALWKMHALARQRIFLVHPAGHDLMEIMGRIAGCRSSFPNHNMLLNLLYEMGWEVQSQIFMREFELPLDLQMNMFRYAQGFEERQIEEMKTYLRNAGRLFLRQGEAWVRRRYVDALLSVFR